MAGEARQLHAAKRAARGAAVDLWRAMQVIEMNRHMAEKLEKTAETSGPAQRAQLRSVASQHREIAAQWRALALGEEAELSAVG